jgi:hypothetical protein
VRVNLSEGDDKMKGIIDRFEGEFVIVEWDDRGRVEISRNLIPKNAREGDCLVQLGDKYIIDEGETQRRKCEIKKLANDLWE